MIYPYPSYSHDYVAFADSRAPEKYLRLGSESVLVTPGHCMITVRSDAGLIRSVQLSNSILDSDDRSRTRAGATISMSSVTFVK